MGYPTFEPTLSLRVLGRAEARAGDVASTIARPAPVCPRKQTAGHLGPKHNAMHTCIEKQSIEIICY
eukprot:6003132-Lingulodinium_polyedra.AAC.1